MSADLPSETAFCSHCGTAVHDDARSCWQCGQALTFPDASAIAPSSPAFSPPTPRGGWRNLFSATGRIGRIEFLLTLVGLYAINIVALDLSRMLNGADHPVRYYLVGGGLFFGALFGGMILFVLAGWKRIQDFNKPGPLVLLSLIPFIGIVLVPIVLLIVPPTKGPNRYGLPNSGSVRAKSTPSAVTE